MEIVPQDCALSSVLSWLAYSRVRAGERLPGAGGALWRVDRSIATDGVMRTRWREAFNCPVAAGTKSFKVGGVHLQLIEIQGELFHGTFLLQGNFGGKCSLK
jgi:hypothetical protein